MVTFSIDELAIPAAAAERLSAILCKPVLNIQQLATLVRAEPALAARCLVGLNRHCPEAVSPLINLEQSFRMVGAAVVRQLFGRLVVVERVTQDPSRLLAYSRQRSRALVSAQLAVLWAVRKHYRHLDQLYLASLVGFCQELQWALSPKAAMPPQQMPVTEALRVWQLPVATIQLFQRPANEAQRCLWYALKATERGVSTLSAHQAQAIARWLQCPVAQVERDFVLARQRVLDKDLIGRSVREHAQRAEPMAAATRSGAVPAPSSPSLRQQQAAASLPPRSAPVSSTAGQTRSVGQMRPATKPLAASPAVKPSSPAPTGGESNELLRYQLMVLKEQIINRRLTRKGLPHSLLNLTLAASQLNRAAFFRYHGPSQSMVLEGQVQQGVAAAFRTRSLCLADHPLLKLMCKKPQVLWVHAKNRHALRPYLPAGLYGQKLPPQLLMMAIHDQTGMVGVLVLDGQRPFTARQQAGLEWLQALQPLIVQLYTLCDRPVLPASKPPLRQPAARQASLIRPAA